jgi:hypothetical protein
MSGLVNPFGLLALSRQVSFADSGVCVKEADHLACAVGRDWSFVFYSLGCVRAYNHKGVFEVPSPQAPTLHKDLPNKSREVADVTRRLAQLGLELVKDSQQATRTTRARIKRSREILNGSEEEAPMVPDA